jgi:hypothetical protein
MSEDNVRRKDSCWSVWTIYDSRELSGVSTVDPRVDGVLHFVIIPSGVQDTMTTTLVMGANDHVSTWMAIITPHHQTIWVHHPILVMIGQELNVKRRGQQRVAMSP